MGYNTLCYTAYYSRLGDLLSSALEISRQLDFDLTPPEILDN